MNPATITSQRINNPTLHISHSVDHSKTGMACRPSLLCPAAMTDHVTKAPNAMTATPINRGTPRTWILKRKIWAARRLAARKTPIVAPPGKRNPPRMTVCRAIAAAVARAAQPAINHNTCLCLREKHATAATVPAANHAMAVNASMAGSSRLGNHDRGKSTGASIQETQARKYAEMTSHMFCFSWANVPTKMMKMARANSATVSRNDASALSGSNRASTTGSGCASEGLSCLGGTASVAMNGSVAYGKALPGRRGLVELD